MKYIVCITIWFIDLFLYSNTEVFFIFTIFSSFFFVGFFALSNYYTSLSKNVIFSIRSLYEDVFRLRSVYSSFLSEFNSSTKEIDSRDLVKKFKTLNFIVYRIRYLIYTEVLNYVKWYSTFKLELFYLYGASTYFGVDFLGTFRAISGVDEFKEAVCDLSIFRKESKAIFDFFPDLFGWIVVDSFFYPFEWSWIELRCIFK